jgi:hypothetical protein
VSDVKITIEGLQEAQDDNAKRIAALKPDGLLGQVIKDATVEAHRYAVAITHMDTGTLRASQRMKIKGRRGEIFIDPGARNPRSKTPPAEYGRYEHGRGGSHAFYDRTVSEEGPKIADRAIARLKRKIP